MRSLRGRPNFVVEERKTKTPCLVPVPVDSGFVVGLKLDLTLASLELELILADSLHRPDERFSASRGAKKGEEDESELHVGDSSSLMLGRSDSKW